MMTPDVTPNDVTGATQEQAPPSRSPLIVVRRWKAAHTHPRLVSFGWAPVADPGSRR